MRKNAGSLLTLRKYSKMFFKKDSDLINGFFQSYGFNVAVTMSLTAFLTSMDAFSS